MLSPWLFGVRKKVKYLGISTLFKFFNFELCKGLALLPIVELVAWSEFLSESISEYLQVRLQCKYTIVRGRNVLKTISKCVSGHGITIPQQIIAQYCQYKQNTYPQEFGSKLWFDSILLIWPMKMVQILFSTCFFNPNTILWAKECVYCLLTSRRRLIGRTLKKSLQQSQHSGELEF